MVVSGNGDLSFHVNSTSREKVLIRRCFFVSLTIILGSWITTSCQFPVVSVDDYTDVLGAKETAVHSVLEIRDGGDVVAEGEVLSLSDLDGNCSIAEGQCYFSMDVEGVTIFIHYLLDPDRQECLNSAASEQALAVRSGDRVKVFGNYFGAANISTCGDLNYYIKVETP